MFLIKRAKCFPCTIYFKGGGKNKKRKLRFFESMKTRFGWVCFSSLHRPTMAAISPPSAKLPPAAVVDNCPSAKYEDMVSLFFSEDDKSILSYTKGERANLKRFRNNLERIEPSLDQTDAQYICLNFLEINHLGDGHQSKGGWLRGHDLRTLSSTTT